MPTKSTTPVVQPEDHLVLRTNGGEMSFTGTEYPMAMEFARAAGVRGRAVLIAYTFRKRCKIKTAAVVIWSAAEERAKAEKAAREAAKPVPVAVKPTPAPARKVAAKSAPPPDAPAPKVRKLPVRVRERERNAVA